MKTINRELHIVTKYGERETYEEFYTESNVANLWYDRLQNNPEIVKATLVYREEKTGIIVESVQLPRTNY